MYGFMKSVHSQNCEVICSASSIYSQVLHATYRSVNVPDSGQRPETYFTQVRRREHLADTLQAQFPNVCAINPVIQQDSLQFMLWHLWQHR